MSPFALPDDDVVEVQRGPEPGGRRWRLPRLWRDAPGPAHDLHAAGRGPPHDPVPRGEDAGLSALPRPPQAAQRFEDTGLEKCVGCSLCAAACPADCIRVVAAENTPDNQVSAGERYAAVYEINMSRCIFCGYCELACPFDAITMGNDYELADYERSDLIFTKEMLLADPPEHTPLRREGRIGPAVWFEDVLLLRRRDRRARRRAGRGDPSQPVLQRALARLPPARPGRAVPAAARGVPRGVADHRLRRRRDGALRVRGRLRRRRRRADAPEHGGVAMLGPLFAAAVFVELVRRLHGERPRRDRLGRRRRRRRLRLARCSSASCC